MSKKNRESEQLTKEELLRRKLFNLAEWTIGILSCSFFISSVVIGLSIQANDYIKIGFIAHGLTPALIGFLCCAKLEQRIGYYECKNCGHKHIPTYKSVLFAPHIGRTRYMKCPKCIRKAWQKKVLSEYKEAAEEQKCTNLQVK